MMGETRLRLTLRKVSLEVYLTIEEMKNTDAGTESLEARDSDTSVDIDDISTGNDDDLLTMEKTKKYQVEKTNSSTSEEKYGG